MAGKSKKKAAPKKAAKKGGAKKGAVHVVYQLWKVRLGHRVLAHIGRHDLRGQFDGVFPCVQSVSHKSPFWQSYSESLGRCIGAGFHHRPIPIGEKHAGLVER